MDDRHEGADRSGPWRTFLLAALAVVLVGAGLVVPREGRDADPGVFGPDDAEHQLATLDRVRTSEEELLRYAVVLDAAESACRQSRDRLTELAAGAQRTADADGARSTTYWLLTSVVQQVGEARADCTDAFDQAAQRATQCEPRGERPCPF